MDGKFIITIKILPKLSLDHHPISLNFEKEYDLAPIPFRFSPLWIERDGFQDIVSQAWSQYVFGSPCSIWEHKLKNTKFDLKNWVKKPLNIPTISRKERVLELSEVQLGMEEREITKSQLALEQFALTKTTQSFHQEEEYVRLKS